MHVCEFYTEGVEGADPGPEASERYVLSGCVLCVNCLHSQSAQYAYYDTDGAGDTDHNDIA